MNETSRRDALKYAAGGMIALLGAAVGHAQAASASPHQDNAQKQDSAEGRAAQGGGEQQGQSSAYDRAADHKRVVEAGMTEAEADCWDAVADAAGKFFDLPTLHPMDNQEVAQAIHIIQYKLLARPTYRKYKELAQAAGLKRPGEGN